MAENNLSITPPLNIEEKSPVMDVNDLHSTLGDQDQKRQLDAAEEELDAAFSQKKLSPLPALEAPQAGPTLEGAGEMAKAAASDVGRGIFEIPVQVLNGVRDAFQSAGDTTKDLADWLEKKVPSLGAGVAFEPGKGFSVLSAEEKKAKGIEFDLPDLPEFKKANTKTGEAFRSVSKFLTGFVGAGKLLEGVSVTTKGAQYGKTILQGGIADATTADENDKRISDLMNEVPVLKTLIPDFLVSDPDDSKAEKRLKAGMEGAGLGLVADGVIKALRASVKLREAKALARYQTKAGGGEISPASIADFELRGLGDPEQGLFATRLSPEGVLEKGKDAEKFINFARFEKPEDIESVINNMAEAFKPGVDKATRGVRTHAQTEAAAQQIDAFKNLMNRRVGQALNAEQSVAARNLWVESANKLKELATLANNVPSEANLYQFNKMLTIHAAIQNQVLGARAEAARALNSWAIKAKGGSSLARQIEGLIDLNGGLEANRKLAKKLAYLAEPENADKLSAAMTEGFWDKTRAASEQIFINVSLLSNPATAAANILGGFTILGNNILERTNASFIAQAMGEGSAVPISEVGDLIKGQVGGIKDAFKASLQTLKTGESKFGKASTMGTSNIQEGGKLSAEFLGVANETPHGQILNVIDTVTNMPGRVMGSGDEFFKSIGYRSYVHVEVPKVVRAELASGKITREQMAERTAYLLDHPPENIHIEAVNRAMYDTFNDKPNEILNGIATSFQRIPVLGKLFLPFKNTPINILTYAAERTPLGVLSERYKTDIAAGGQRAMLARSRVATGTGIMAVTLDYALSGQITGSGPQEPGQKALFQREGKQAYSVKIGDKWVAYNRLDPLGMTMGLAADIAQIVQNSGEELDPEEYAGAVFNSILAISDSVLSRSYMKGAAGLVEAIENANKRENFIKNFPAIFAPAGLGAVAKKGIPGLVEGDPYLRTADGMVQAIQRKIPGLSEKLPLQRDLWGRPIDVRSGFGQIYDLFSPVYVKTENPEPIDKELKRLEFFPQMPSARISYQGVTIKLDGAEYSKYLELLGNGYKHLAWGVGLKDFLNEVVSGNHPLSPVYEQYSDGSDGGKAEFIRRWMKNYRDQAKAEFMENTPTAKAKFNVERKLNDPYNIYPGDE